MLRSLLSHYANVPPPAWIFEVDGFGKPRITEPSCLAPEFSLSHTHGLVCCAFSRQYAIGVDVESLDRPLDVSSVAQRYCSPFEQRDLEGLSDLDRRARFLSYWTLKESLAKAIGCGLSMDVSRFSFQIHAKRIQVAFDQIAEEPATWSFGLFQRVSHTIAVSVRAPAIADVQIRLRETTLASLQCRN